MIDDDLAAFIGDKAHVPAKIPEHEKRTPRFSLHRVSSLEVRAPLYLIRTLLEADTLALAFGDPGVGKSFLGIDIACCIATGTPFHGLAVETGPVVYLAGEGRNGLARRFKAWEIRNQRELANAPIFVSSGPAALVHAPSALEVAATVDEIAAEHGAPLLVVIDTLARNYGPGNENSTEDMSAFIQAADMIRSRHGATVLLIHHTGHTDKSRARGAMALKAALDCEYRMDKDDLGTVRFEATKMKDAPEPEPMAFVIRSVELGIVDEHGDQVTSAVLDSTSYEPSTAGNEGRGKWQTTALDTLASLHASHRANREANGHDPDGARVTLDSWRDACVGAGMPRGTWYRNKDALAEIGRIKVDHGFVSLSGS